MSRTIFVLNGPNLNMLGKREPGIYGGKTLADIEADCKVAGAELGLTIDFRQSNHEGALVDLIQGARTAARGIIINPGAYSHTSVAILDALNAFEGPVLEVHISNIYSREEFRRHSFISPHCKAVISGLGLYGYEAALHFLVLEKA
mgnify:CR=1 FL=1